MLRYYIKCYLSKVQRSSQAAKLRIAKFLKLKNQMYQNLLKISHKYFLKYYQTI